MFFLPLRKAAFRRVKSETAFLLAAHCRKILFVFHIGRDLVSPLLELIFQFPLIVNGVAVSGVSRNTDVDSYVSLINSTVLVRNMQLEVRFISKDGSQRIVSSLSQNLVWKSKYLCSPGARRKSGPFESALSNRSSCQRILSRQFSLRIYDSYDGPSSSACTIHPCPENVLCRTCTADDLYETCRLGLLSACVLPGLFGCTTFALAEREDSAICRFRSGASRVFVACAALAPRSPLQQTFCPKFACVLFMLDIIKRF